MLPAAAQPASIAAPPAPAPRAAAAAAAPHRHKRPRGASLAARADPSCRDMVNTPRAPAAAAEGTATVVFLGAGGQAVEVPCDMGAYILDAGLDAGLELPFTCRGGICGACVGRIAEGAVDQGDIADLSFTLSDDEQAQGMALLCMARPAAARVVVETQSDWGYSLGVGEWKGATGEIAGREPTPLMGDKWEK